MSNVLGRLAGELDLPAEVVAGAPRVTLTGTERVMVENHHGILSYSETEVAVGGRGLLIRIRGDSLLLRAMDAEMLLVTGHIFGVDVE